MRPRTSGGRTCDARDSNSDAARLVRNSSLPLSPTVSESEIFCQPTTNHLVQPTVPMDTAQKSRSSAFARCNHTCCRTHATCVMKDGNWKTLSVGTRSFIDLRSGGSLENHVKTAHRNCGPKCEGWKQAPKKLAEDTILPKHWRKCMRALFKAMYIRKKPDVRPKNRHLAVKLLRILHRTLSVICASY